MDADAVEFIDLAREILGTSTGAAELRTLTDRLEEMGRRKLLSDLDEAVSGFEDRAVHRLENLKFWQGVLLASALLILAAEACLIFIPFNRMIVSTLKSLDDQVNTDTLTGLPNRKRFSEYLAERAETVRADQELVVVALDLDGFKAVNDSLGHPAGDELLRMIASLLDVTAQILRSEEEPIVCRLGGDEFTISAVLPRDRAIVAVEELSASLIEALKTPFQIPSRDGTERCLVGISLGLALASDSPGSIDRLVSNADIALYASKRNGKGRLTRFEAKHRTIAEKRLRLETDVRSGILSGEFVPYYQPQVDILSGELVGFEVLARWRHPKRGLLLPNEFISLAEEIGVIDRLEAAVFFRAFEDVRGFLDQGLEVPRISINVSASALRDPQFVENLASTADMFGLPYGSIAVEILETVLIEEGTDPASDNIRQLADRGFPTVLDDFGTGYSSVSSAAGLELTELKVDKSLVWGAYQKQNEKLLQACIDMGHSMGLKVCAEGVETEESLDLLLKMGCDTAQGHYFAKSLEAKEAVKWLTHSDEPNRITKVAAFD